MRAWNAVAAMVAAASLLVAGPAGGEDDQTAPKPAPAEAAAAPADAEDATVAAAAPAEFKIPPGFRKKQRGKHTVYCRKETVMGTRMEQEKCYDEQGLREYELALRENQEKIDQLRRICGTARSCASN